MQIYVKPPAYKSRWQEICAILPAYLEGGINGTAITYLDGSAEQVDKRLCWVVNDLLFHLRSSTSVLMRRSRMLLGKTARRVPLVLNREFTLVPVKGREKLSRYDAQTGYVVLRHVACVMQEEDRRYIGFNGGAKVRVYDNLRTFIRNIRTTEQLLEQNEPQAAAM